MKMIKVKAIIVAMFLSLFLVSCGGQQGTSNLQIPGVDGPKVTLMSDSVLISAVFQNLILDGGLRYTIPKYPNSFIEVGPDFQSGGTLMSVNVSLKDIFAHVDGGLILLEPQKLPGGRPLPGVLSGQLPAVAFSIEKFKNMSIYLGPKVFGVFFPINLDIGVNNIITARYYVNSKRGGNLSLVGKDEKGENSGFLLLLDLGQSQINQLRKLVK